MYVLSLGFIFLISSIIYSYTTIFIHNIFFTITHNIQQLIVFIIPIYIFLSIYKSTQKLLDKSPVFIAKIIFIILISNFINIYMFINIGGYIISKPDITHTDSIKSLSILYSIPLKAIFSNITMMSFGILLGIANIFSLNNIFYKSLELLKHVIEKYLIYIIKIMLIGSIINIMHSKILNTLLSKYYFVVLIILISYAIIVSIYLLIIKQSNQLSSMFVLQNMIKPISIGAPAMSSSLSIPSNIESTIKNTKDSIYSNFIIPIITSIHTHGCSIIVPFLIHITIAAYGYDIPNFYLTLEFSIYYSILKLSVSGIPAGGIILIYELLTNVFLFDTNMISFITSLYITCDILCTFGNIMFNNLMAVVLYKYYK